MPNDASASAIVNGLCLVVAVVVAVFSSQVISCGECCSMMNKFLGSCRWVAGNVRMNSILGAAPQNMPPDAGLVVVTSMEPCIRGQGEQALD